MVGVVLVGALAGGWLLLRGGAGRGPQDPPDLSERVRRGSPSRSPSPAAEAVKLRPVTGEQLCAAVPDSLRKSLVSDGKYGGRDAATQAASATEKRASCGWRNSKMDVGDGVIGYRTLTISVEAESTDGQNAVEHAKEEFDSDKKTNERRVNVRDGRRTDGKTTGSAFGELKPLTYGDASYSQSSIGLSGLKATVYVRQGPWLIEVSYGGSNRSGAKYPTGDEVRAAAGKVADRVTAEMAKDAGKVKITGPCGTITAGNVESAFFPTAEGPSVGGTDGRVQQVTCAWKISEAVEHEPGQEYTTRGGTFRVHLVDWGDDEGAAFQFDRDAKKYDRYRAKGGIGNSVSHTDFEARRQLSGLGDKAFAVVSTTTRPGEPEEEPRREVLIEVLIGERTVEFTFGGTTTGGGIVGAPDYRPPALDPSAAQAAMTRLAGKFLAGLK